MDFSCTETPTFSITHAVLNLCRNILNIKNGASIDKLFKKNIYIYIRSGHSLRFWELAYRESSSVSFIFMSSYHIHNYHLTSQVYFFQSYRYNCYFELQFICLQDREIISTLYRSIETDKRRDCNEQDLPYRVGYKFWALL